MTRAARMGKNGKKAGRDAAASPFISCTDEERAQIISDFGALRADRMRAFLREHGQKGAGAKEVMAGRLEKELRAGTISLQTIVEFLDYEASWGKQHAFLLGPPIATDETDPKCWADPKWLRLFRLSVNVTVGVGS